MKFIYIVISLLEVCTCLPYSRERPAAEMVLFKQNVKEVKGALADYLKEHVKAEHNREFE
jgi:hypothetical protein